MHGGAMRIRSALGKGTMVVVRLPLEAKPQMRAERTDAAA
jgi:signal transduction histidine kinase